MTQIINKKHWDSSHIADLTGKVAIVTGSNSGIGYETVRALAKKNAQVIMAVRNAQKGEKALARIKADNPQAQVKIMSLDLANLASVHAFADSFKSNYQQLDLLINNAGVMVPPFTKTADGFELQMGTNHLGHFALSGLLMERLMQTPQSRLVVLGSAAHKWGNIDFDDLTWEKRPYNDMRAYADSKIANLYFLSELSRRVKDMPNAPLVTGAHPGWTSTDLQQTTSLRFANWLFAMPGWKGALPTLRAACDPEAQYNDYYGPKGLMEMNGYPIKVGRSEKAQDAAIARKLWDVSEELTGIKFFAES